MADINQESLSHLAKLSRLTLSEEEIGKFLVDLKKILDHFAELEAVPTEGIIPVSGGTEEKNVLREDVLSERPFDPTALIEAFP